MRFFAFPLTTLRRATYFLPSPYGWKFVFCSTIRGVYFFHFPVGKCMEKYSWKYGSLHISKAWPVSGFIRNLENLEKGPFLEKVRENLEKSWNFFWKRTWVREKSWNFISKVCFEKYNNLNLVFCFPFHKKTPFLWFLAMSRYIFKCHSILRFCSFKSL